MESITILAAGKQSVCIDTASYMCKSKIIFQAYV